MLRHWSSINFDPQIPSLIQNQIIWNNKYILINNLPIKQDSTLFNFVGNFYNISGNLKTWEVFKQEYNTPDSYIYKWIQIRHAIPRRWTTCIRNNLNAFNISNGNLQEQHVQFKSRDIPLEKLTSKLFYIMLTNEIKCASPSEPNIQQKLPLIKINWPKVYLYPRKVTLDTYARMFSFKILHNRLFLNQALHASGVSDSPLCSYCARVDETVVHIFSLCPKIKLLWIQIKKYFLPEIVLPQLDSYNAVLGFPSSSDMLACHLHLIFKIYVYKNRENKKCNLNGFLNKVKLIKNIENHLSFANENLKRNNCNKWIRIRDKF